MLQMQLCNIIMIFIVYMWTWYIVIFTNEPIWFYWKWKCSVRSVVFNHEFDLIICACWKSIITALIENSIRTSHICICFDLVWIYYTGFHSFSNSLMEKKLENFNLLLKLSQKMRCWTNHYSLIMPNSENWFPLPWANSLVKFQFSFFLFHLCVFDA